SSATVLFCWSECRMNSFPSPRAPLPSGPCRMVQVQKHEFHKFSKSGREYIGASVLLLAILMLALGCGHARANVYATNLRLNGAITNAPLAPGGSVLISYLLNEPATLGVTVDVKQGATTVRSIVLTNGGPGTAVGSNSVSWDGTDSTGHMLPGGSYAVSI